MEQIPFGLGKRGYLLMIAIAAGLGGLLFGYDTSVISGAILFVRNQFHLTSVQTEVAVSAVLAGAVIGAAFAGYFGDHFGRKPVLITGTVIFLLGSALFVAAEIEVNVWLQNLTVPVVWPTAALARLQQYELVIWEAGQAGRGELPDRAAGTRDGEVGGITMFTQVITERKNAELALRRQRRRADAIAGRFRPA